MTTITIDPPAQLPVDYLSLSSLRLFMQCPWKWKLRHIDKKPEPPSGKMILGSAAGAALTHHFGQQIQSGEGISTEELLDQFATGWEDRISREEVVWRDDRPGALKDSGAGALRVYHRHIAPGIVPVSTERKFELTWPGVQWCLTGFIDLEDDDGRPRDYKMGKRVSQKDADADFQATIYCGARRAEGNPAPAFCFDNLILNKQPTADVITTERTDEDLDRLTDRVFTLAREIAWRTETETWSGAAPGTWFCSTCRYDCPLRLGNRP